MLSDWYDYVVMTERKLEVVSMENSLQLKRGRGILDNSVDLLT